MSLRPTPITLLTILLLCANPDRTQADTGFLPDPATATASTFFNANYAPGNLYDASPTGADLETTFPAGSARQYAGIGAGPHVIVFDFGSPVTFSGIAYSQRAGDNPSLDKVQNIDVWVSDTAPGPAATNLPVLSNPVDANTGQLLTSGTTFRNYPLGTELTGQWIVLRLNDAGGNVGNPGGSELQLTFELPDPDPDLVAPGNLDLGTIEVDETLLQGRVPVSNAGASQTLSIGKITFTGPDASNFAVNTFPATLAPGADGEILVDFTPGSEVRSYLATMVITSTDANTATTPVELSARATVAIPDTLELLADPVSVSASSFFNATYAPEFLFDAELSVEDVESRSFVAQDPQYAGVGIGPHVLVLDYGEAVTFDSLVYAQRLGGISNLDKAPGMDFWVTDTDPGPAAIGMPILSGAPDASITGLTTTDSILHYYALGTSLSGQFVVIRLQQGNGNTGGAELGLARSAPMAAATITSITPVGGGIWELTLAGAADTAYEFRSSAILNFSPGTLVEGLTQGDPGDPGSIGGNNNNILTTDSNGDGTARMMLTGSPADFVRAQIPPPLLSEDFESVAAPGVPADWSVADNGAGTAWTVGSPAGAGTEPDAAAGGTQCAGTNIGANYTGSAVASIITRAFSVPASGAVLRFSQYIDTEAPISGDLGSIRLLNAGDDSVLAGGDVAIGLEGITETWTRETLPLPAAANGLNVKLEFRFESDSDGETFAGFYIDDLTVTVP